MPARGETGYWRRPPDPNDGGMYFERGQRVVLPSGRLAVVSQYWVRSTQMYCGCAAIRYVDNGDTAVINMNHLRSWHPHRTYWAVPRAEIAGATFNDDKPVAPKTLRVPGKNRM